MYARNSHLVVEHDHCQIQPVVFDKIAQCFMQYVKDSKAKIYNERTEQGNIRFLGIRQSQSTKEIVVIVVTRNRKLPFTKQLVRVLLENSPDIVGIIQDINPYSGNRILGTDHKILWGKKEITEYIDDVRFDIPYNSFFQINPGTTLQVYDFIKNHLKRNSRVIDAYCGLGSIGIYIADKADKVIGIERDAGSIEAAEKNKTLNGKDNCDFFAGDVEQDIEEYISKYDIDTVIFDPPRKGLNRNIIDIIAAASIHNVIYVSCNPSTQIRDIDHFEQKGYGVKQIQPFDMFPQTYHIENVVLMEK
jgi:23S rRNA (uracil1939-C5)-methyltransferase